MPGATPPSPPSSPEKEESENKIEAESPNGQPDTAKTLQALLQHRIQQLQQNNKQYMRNVSHFLFYAISNLFWLVAHGQFSSGYEA